MKSSKIFVGLLIILGFSMNTVKPQAIVVKGRTWILEAYETAQGTWGPYYSTETSTLYTPSGNRKITTIFQLAMDDPRVPENGINKIPAIAYLPGYPPVAGEKIITSDGRAMSVFIVDGQPKIKMFNAGGGCPYFNCTGEQICGEIIAKTQYWNNNFHMELYGAFVGQISGFHYSTNGICNERINYPGKAITVPMIVKMENKIVAVVYMDYEVTIDDDGVFDLEQTGGTLECR